MRGTNRPPFTADIYDRPFSLPADSIEIIIDLPLPPSTNRIWRHARGRTFKSAEYVAWGEQADICYMLARARQRGRLPKISGPFEACILLAEGRGDGDNRIKAVLDWAESRDLVRNDSDCRRGSWEWVETERAPKGCRLTLRSLHG